MRYLLVVGFACDVFKKEPQARIFVGNKLLDEFHIHQTQDNLLTSRQEFHKKLHPLQPIPWTEIHSRDTKNFPPLKFYELQVDKRISNLEIRIHIDNHDNNYNNGFMTRTTLIKLNVFDFFPLHQKLLRRLEKIRNSRRISENYAWYLSFKNFIFDLTLNAMQWNAVNGQKITATSLSDPLLILNHSTVNKYTVGGDGVYECHLVKKYGILMPKLARACRLTFKPHIVNYLFDKYQQYAHQRHSY